MATRAVEVGSSAFPHSPRNARDLARSEPKGAFRTDLKSILAEAHTHSQVSRRAVFPFRRRRRRASRSRACGNDRHCGAHRNNETR